MKLSEIIADLLGVIALLFIVLALMHAPEILSFINTNHIFGG